MKLKYVLLSIITFLLVIPNVYADGYCGKNDILRVKDDASNITIEAELYKDENDKETGTFNLIIKGLTDELYLKDNLTGQIYNYKNLEEGTLILKNKESNNYVFNIYYDRCEDELMRTIRYKLPKYNHYANDPLCEGITGEELDVCDKWYSKDLNDDKFKQRIEEYKESLGISNNDNNSNNKMMDFFKKYYIYFIGLAIAIIIIISVIVVNKKRGALE